MAVFAVGAFGNSVQAQWLSENFNSLGAGVNLTVGGNCVAVGSAGFATGATGGGALRIIKAATVAGTDLRYSLSDTSYSMNRPSGYITFKIQQSSGVTSVNSSYMTFRVGAGDANNLSSQSAAWFEGRFIQMPYLASGVASSTANFKPYPGGAASSLGNYSINNGSSSVKMKFFYNGTASPISYTSPATGLAVSLGINSFVVYAGGVLVSPSATGSSFGVTTVTTTTTGQTANTIGKIGFVIGTSQAADFIIDDIYAADAAPSRASINSATTATAQAGYPFSYTITSSGVASPVYSTSPLPSGLSLKSSTGVISGTISAGATQGLNSYPLMESM